MRDAKRLSSPSLPWPTVVRGGAVIAHSLGLPQCSAFAPAPTEKEFQRYVLREANKSGLFEPLSAP